MDAGAAMSGEELPGFGPMTPEDMQAYFLQASPGIQVEFMQRALGAIKAVEPPTLKDQYGVQWWEAPEGQQLNGAQLVARFLSWDNVTRTNYMAHINVVSGRAATCTMQNHAGAVHYAMRHVCKPRRKPKNRGRRRRQTIRKARKQ